MNRSDHIYGFRAGFTILEVLVSIAILSMIATIVFGTFFYTVNNAEQLEDRAALYHRANFILGLISEGVVSAYAPYGGTTVDEEGERPAFQGGSEPLGETSLSSLSMYTTAQRFAGGRIDAEIAYVSYEVFEASEMGEIPGWIKDENNPLVFACTVEPLFALSSGENEYSGEEYPTWTLNIRSLHIAFFDGSEWLEEWNFEDQGLFPAAVTIELELCDADGGSHTFLTMASVHANTLLEELPGAVTEEVGEEEGEEEQEGDEEGEEQEEEGNEETEESEESNPFSSGNEGDEGIFPQDPGPFPFGYEEW